LPLKEIPEIRGTCTALLSLFQLQRDAQTNYHFRQLFDECNQRAVPRAIQQVKSLAKDDEISLYTVGIMSMTDTTTRFGKTEKQWNQNHIWIQWNMHQRSNHMKFVTTIIITMMMIVINP
jgi:hypothetical protein